MSEFKTVTGEVIRASLDAPVIPIILGEIIQGSGELYEDVIRDKHPEYSEYDVHIRSIVDYSDSDAGVAKTIFYAKAVNLDIPQYQAVNDYNHGILGRELFMEVTLQELEYKRMIYVPLKRVQDFCTMVRESIDYLVERLSTFVDSYHGYHILALYDAGGWEREYAIDDDCVKEELASIISGMRVVEEVPVACYSHL